MRVANFLSIALLLSHCGPSLPSLAPTATQPSGSAPIDAPPMPGILRITILDVGQGDSTVIALPDGETILIDGGPPGAGTTVILPYLASQGIAQLTASVASHYDLDHIGGLAEVFDGPDGLPETADDLLPTACWDRGGDPPTDTAAMREYLARRGPCHRTMEAGATLRMGALEIAVPAANGVLTVEGATCLPAGMALAPVDNQPHCGGEGSVAGEDPALPVRASQVVGGAGAAPPMHDATLAPVIDENAHSVALLLRYGTFTYLTLGDLPGGGGEAPYTTIDLETPLAPRIGHVTVLHAAHHGSQTSTNPTFLAAIRPEAVVISVGNANPYGHPHLSVLRRLAAIGMPIYLTEHGDQDLPPTAIVANGPITIESDGKSYAITVE